MKGSLEENDQLIPENLNLDTGNPKIIPSHDNSAPTTERKTTLGTNFDDIGTNPDDIGTDSDNDDPTAYHLRRAYAGCTV